MGDMADLFGRSLWAPRNGDGDVSVSHTPDVTMDLPAAVLDPQARMAYVLAGASTLTLQGRTSHFTYRVLANQKQPSNVSHWVHVLTGPDNVEDFTFLGGITPQGFYVSTKSTIGADARSAVAFAWWFSHPADPRVEMMHAGRCGRCKRKLTHPESIKTGLGPVCAEYE